MHKRLISFFLVFSLLLSLFSISAFADDAHQHTFENKREYDLTNLPDGYQIPFTVYEAPCSGGCGYSEYSWNIFGISGKFVDKTGTPALTVYKHYREWFESTYGKNATATKAPSGIGRKDLPGYESSDNNPGVPSISQDGNIALLAKYRFTNNQNQLVDSFSKQVGNDIWNFGENSLYIERYSNSSTKCYTYCGYILDTHNVPGIYYVPAGTSYVFNPWGSSNVRNLNWKEWPENTSLYVGSSSSDGSKRYLCIYRYNADKTYDSYRYPEMHWSIGDGTDNIFRQDSGYSISTSGNITIPYPKDLVVYLRPTSTNIVKNTNITINNNTWNGNIYTDNSTNLTYIYPQYTTINEKNETVTNISNTPIIYNNETKQYYTYDQTTKNYYYITYNTQPTPTPSPTPAPTDKPGGDISTPETGKPGGDGGDTTGILTVLVEIRDNMIQGFLDIKAAFVAGFAELSANFTLAIENLNVNIQNIFNKKFPDQSTPETAQPTPTPSPEPTETPSPTDTPSATPSPSPAPTGKPDGRGDTNNFWNIFIGGGSDDGSDGDHKGIFWALVSLILALIAFFTNLFAGVAYLFPFLPEGVVMTINTCLFVVFLFVIIKFIMRSK